MGTPRLNRRVRRGLDIILAILADRDLGSDVAAYIETDADREGLDSAIDWIHERIRKESRHG